ncbi:MAG: FixH family protein [Acidobacteriota bacterium]
MNRRSMLGVVMSGLLAVVAAAAGCGGGSGRLTELQRVRSGALDVVVLSPHDALRHGKDDFVIEFKSADGRLVEVGEVRASASMPMPGMPMFSSVTVQRADAPGRYRAEGDFSMAGTWRLTVEWDGPAGKGSVAFSGSVQ